MIERKKSFTRGELLWFGPLFALFAAMLCGIAIRKFDAPRVAMGIGVVALAVIVIYYVVPSLRRPLFAAWLATVFPIGWLLSHFLLALVFYLVVLPIGLFLKLFRYDPLRRSFDRQAASYWIRRALPSEPKRYFQQF